LHPIARIQDARAFFTENASQHAVCAKVCLFGVKKINSISSKSAIFGSFLAVRILKEEV